MYSPANRDATTNYCKVEVPYHSKSTVDDPVYYSLRLFRGLKKGRYLIVCSRDPARAKTCRPMGANPSGSSARPYEIADQMSLPAVVLTSSRNLPALKTLPVLKDLKAQTCHCRIHI